MPWNNCATPEIVPDSVRPGCTNLLPVQPPPAGGTVGVYAASLLKIPTTALATYISTAT